MPAPQAKLGAKWLSVTDIRTTLTRINSNRAQHDQLLRNQATKLASHADQIAGSLRGLSPKDRPSVVAKSVAGMRADLLRDTGDQRLAYTRELGALAEQLKAGATHYRSPMQMLMRETLGSERRSRIMQQIAGSGPVELASLAEFAAATDDKELAAALCSRVADFPRADRPFSAAALADVMFGDLHRELSQAMVEADRRVLESLNEDAAFETGKANPQRSLQIALLKKREAEIGAYGPEAEDDEEMDETEEVAEEQHQPNGPVDRIATGLAARRSSAANPAE